MYHLIYSSSILTTVRIVKSCVMCLSPVDLERGLVYLYVLCSERSGHYARTVAAEPRSPFK